MLNFLGRLLRLVILAALFLGLLPFWLLLFITIGVVMLGAGKLLLGSRARDHMVGILAADVVRFFLRVLVAPFRRAFGE